MFLLPKLQGDFSINSLLEDWTPRFGPTVAQSIVEWLLKQEVVVS